MADVEERVPTLAEYQGLRESVGWRRAADGPTAQALGSSVAGAVAVADGEVVGMGRLVGDRSLYLFLVDLVVRPEHQGRGVGGELLGSLLRSAAAVSVTGVVHLIADDEVAGFYERLGWERSSSGLLSRSV